MEVFINRDEVRTLVPPSDYTFYGETSVFSVLLTAAIFANGPLLFIYIRSKHIRSVADRFLANMLIANLICVVVLLPSILLDLLLPESQGVELELSREREHDSVHWSRALLRNGSQATGLNYTEVVGEVQLMERSVLFLTQTGGSWTCAFKKSILSGLSTASMLAALEIAVERYLAVVNPLHYHEFVTRNGVVTVSIVGNAVAVVSGFLSSFDPCQPVFPGCVRNSVQYSASVWWPLYTLVHVTLFFLLPVLFMTFIYIKIWWEARRQRAKMSANPFFLNAPAYPSQPTLHHAHATAEDGRKEKHHHRFHLHPILLRFKLIDRLIAPRMDRAARVAVCTLFVSISCWAPFNFVEGSHALSSVLRQMGGTSPIREDWNHYETLVPLFFASLHPILTPFFYAYRYKRLRQEVIKTCHLTACRRSPAKHILVDYHDAPIKSPHVTLTASSSDLGLHDPSDPLHPLPPCPSPPSTPTHPKFHIGPDSDAELDIQNPVTGSYATGLNVTDMNGLEAVLVVSSGHSTGIRTSFGHSTVPCPVDVSHHMGFLSSVVQVMTLWWSSYSKRWSIHRESVTSNSSVVTLISRRSGASVTATHV